ncbi:hypothetical protein SprV_0401526000 [Sparganum proliferum]
MNPIRGGPMADSDIQLSISSAYEDGRCYIPVPIFMAFLRCLPTLFAALPTITTDRGAHFASRLIHYVLIFISCKQIQGTYFLMNSNRIVKR